MDRTLIRDFWGCGDNEIIEFALLRARLSRNERDVVENILDGCRTQEQTAEDMGISSRQVQKLWSSGCDKLLRIPWVKAYARELRKRKE